MDMMRRVLMACLLCLLPAAAPAEGWVTLGWGRLFNNDALGDGQDRWRSGSYTLSLLRGPGWTGALPATLGTVLEYRLSGAVLSPDQPDAPVAGDRRYAAPLSFGVHSHLAWRGWEGSLGADLVATGPQTGIGVLQSWLHDALGMAEPDLSDQIGDAVYPTLRGEVGRRFAVPGQTTLRPFVAAEVGVETLVRAGGDVIIGSFGDGGLLVRDDSTGQRFRAIPGGRPPAVSLTLGGDVAHVFGSALLQDGGATATRGRLRAGVAWQGARSSAFYGVTYLTPEFDSQPKGQLVGSVNLNFRF
jgi:hypothetical protein